MSAISWSTVENALHAWVVAGSGLVGNHVIWSLPAAGGKRPAPPYIALTIASHRGVGHDWIDKTRNVVAYAGGTFTADASDVVTLTAHGLSTGDGPVRVSSAGTLPGGLAAATDYWAIATGANTLKLAASHLLALAGTSVNITSAGIGAHTLVGGADFVRQGAEMLRTARGMRMATLTLQCFATDEIGAAGARAILSDVIASLPLQRYAIHLGGAGISECGPIAMLPGKVGTALEPRATMTVTMHLASEVTGTGSSVERIEVERTSAPTGTISSDDGDD